jgi:hypothetical protein
LPERRDYDNPSSSLFADPAAGAEGCVLLIAVFGNWIAGSSAGIVNSAEAASTRAYKGLKQRRFKALNPLILLLSLSEYCSCLFLQFC